ncbi:MAG: DUF6370 family protein [Limisphaerales bacterium]
MKNFLAFLTVAAALTLSAQAQEKEKTIKGEGLCLKCELKKADKCQNGIRVKEDGKEVLYTLEQNDVSKAFHKNICSGTAKVTAVGTVKKDGDKIILVASKIELDK